MNSILKSKALGLAALVLAALMLTVTPTWAEQKRAGDTSHRFDRKKDVQRTEIRKIGFYSGIRNGFVKLKEDVTRKKLSYIANKNLVFTHKGQEVDPVRFWPSAIVELVIVDAEVVEIILLVEAS